MKYLKDMTISGKAAFALFAIDWEDGQEVPKGYTLKTLKRDDGDIRLCVREDWYESLKVVM